jgi:hypothetical protein
MPIRTNRGRAAVYRRLWGWPMRSPRHLAVVVFVVAALVLASGIIVPQLTGRNGRQPGAAAETSTETGTTQQSAPGSTDTPGVTGTASTLPTRITEPPQPTETTEPEPAALEAAHSWGRAWVHHPEGMTSDQWLSALRPFTTEEYLTEMATVEPANIDATKVTGPPEAVESFKSSVKVKLPTDDGDLLITVIDTPDGWRVAFYEQVS